jgi:hypothetical protein
MTDHRAICYDDEGRLDCSCRCRFAAEQRRIEEESIDMEVTA